MDATVVDGSALEAQIHTGQASGSSLMVTGSPKRTSTNSTLVKKARPAEWEDMVLQVPLLEEVLSSNILH